MRNHFGRRVLVFWIISLVLAVLAGAWFSALEPTETEDRIRDAAVRIQQRIRAFCR